MSDIQEATEKPFADADYFDLQRFTGAWRNISHDPQRAGQAQLEGCVRELLQVWGNAFEKAGRPAGEIKAKFDEILNRFKENYRTKTYAWLDAMARTASPMITGSSNFPVRMMEKRNETCRKRLGELCEWTKKVIPIVFSQCSDLRPIEDRNAQMIASAVADVKSSLKTILEIDNGTERGCTRALFVNSIVGKTMTLARDNQFDAVRAVKQAVRDWDAGHGKEKKPSITAKNKFWLILDVAPAKTEQPAAVTETIFSEAGVEIIRDQEDERYKITFPGKPSASIISKLKGAGWRWSPSNSAWQRHLTGNSRASAFMIAKEAVFEMSQSK
jgi:hypothetical protein